MLRPCRRGIGRALAVLVVCSAASGAWEPLGLAAAETSAVVIMYHRFGESKYPSTNISLEQFEAHLDELRHGGYSVLPLGEIVGALGTGKPLPDRTVGLSIDDAFLSVYEEAWPRLKAAGFPVTLFVATKPVDRKLSDYMNWAQIRELAAAGVAIGSQTATHLHMADSSRQRNAADVAASNGRFRAELGRTPTLFAYPYGEAGLAVEAVVREAGFVAAFGQHSGAMGPGDDRFYLPRFAMNEAYGDLARFRLAANSLALPVTDVTPADPVVTTNNPPAIGFTVTGEINGLRRLSCYASHVGGSHIERLGARRFEVRVAKPFPRGRTRLNCTVPAGNGRWYWLGRQFYVPKQTGAGPARPPPAPVR